MKRIHIRGGTLAPAALLVVGLASMALPATLAAQGPARGGGTAVASAAVFAGGVDFLPEVRYREAIVTVSGNGLTFRRVIEAGKGLSIGVFDPEGQLLPDGVYKWELELVPHAKAAEKLRAAAAQNGGIAPQAWRRETGTLTIRNGQVAVPDLVEPGPEPRAAGGPGSALAAPAAGASAARGAAGDDDSAVGSRRGVEASVQVALESSPKVSAATGVQPDRASVERSDAAAQAMGRSLEPALAPANPGLEAPPLRPMMNNNSENESNGRSRSDKRR